VQGDRLACLKELLRLTLELVEVGTGGKLLGCHKASMLNASGPQAGQHGDSRAVISLVGWTQSFARTRMRPKRIGTMASGELGVKLSISSTPASFPYHPRQRRLPAVLAALSETLRLRPEKTRPPDDPS